MCQGFCPPRRCVLVRMASDSNTLPTGPDYAEQKADTLPHPVSSASTAVDTARLWLSPMDVFSLRHLMTDVDPLKSTFPLAAYCFMTGFIDSVSFTAIFVWCGFQTGNSVQLALALARLFSGPPGQRDTSFHIADQQALTSVITFILGASLGRIGDRMGAKTRAWLALGTFIQALFTMAAAVTAWQSGQGSIAESRGDPAWTNALTFVALGFMSASLGLQGIMGKRVNTQFATTIVLTTVWCELMADPKLFNFKQRIISRDHKLIAIFALFFGGFVGRALIDKIGAAGTLGVGTGLGYSLRCAGCKEGKASAKKPLTA
ncbi:hypothetical protein A0H81_02078 [Grifola frondosa]|uniref:DUF1275 domain protein n=1 Tax=Grifola frondosa TaxID=5627 RepID=A0A1C7MM54_GRIFR|nr:hypothetical protein A0H81_02078 [Grifola frondosa]